MLLTRVLLLTLLTSCAGVGSITGLTSPDLPPRPIPIENSFTGSLPPAEWLSETIQVNISFQRDSIDAALVCDYIFQARLGTNCTYACALGFKDKSKNAALVVLEKPQDRTPWEVELARLIKTKPKLQWSMGGQVIEYSTWTIGPLGDIGYPPEGGRYANAFEHEVGGHGVQDSRGLPMDHKGFR